MAGPCCGQVASPPPPRRLSSQHIRRADGWPPNYLPRSSGPDLLWPSETTTLGWLTR